MIVGLGLAFAGNHFLEKRKGERTDRRMDEKFDGLKAHTDKRLDRTDSEVAKLSAHVVGPDGSNGLRRDVAEIKRDMQEIKNRELDRLNDAALHGTPDRRRRRTRGSG